MKRLRLVVALLVGIVLIAGSTACGQQSETEQLQTAVVQRGDIALEVSADGTLALISDRKLAFETGGKVAELMVREGDSVAKGQVLAKLDTESMERAIRTAEIGVKSAELAMKSTEVDLTQAQEAVKLAEIDLELVSNNYQKIFTPNPYQVYSFAVPASVDEMQTAERLMKEAQDDLLKAAQGEPYYIGDIQNKLAQAQEVLASAETRLGWGLDAGVRPPNIDYWSFRALELQVDKAKAALENARSTEHKVVLAIDRARNEGDRAQIELERARAELGKVAIASPFDGVITKVNINAGDTVSQISSTAIEVIDPSRLELTIKVDEIDIPLVKAGQKATIGFDALPDRELEGAITSINSLPDVEAGVVSYKVKINLEIPEDLGVKAGMSGTADILIEKHSNVLLVPSRAVKTNAGGAPVVEVMVNGKPEERAVEVGISDGFQTEITGGLSEGETIVEGRTRASNSLFD